MPKYPYHISEEADGDYRIVKSFEVKAKDQDKADEKADEELETFKENLNVQAE